MKPLFACAAWGILLLAGGLPGLRAQPGQPIGLSPSPELRCGLLPLAPAQRAAQAALVVEATVLGASPYQAGGHLYTRHCLRVSGLLKGNIADTTGLSIVTEGGRLGARQEMLTNTLQLTNGQQGVLFLYPAPWPGAAGGWAVYGSRQGFIAYDPATGTAAEPFVRYPAVDAAFYAALARQAGRAAWQVPPQWPARPAPVVAARGTLAPTVSALSPAQLTAGTGTVLTITGSGFGAAQGAGYVAFRNADDGGMTLTRARPADYLQWTDTQIRVRVPSVGSGGQPAGTGPVQVSTADQLSTESPAPLTVRYALTNVESTDGRLLQAPTHVALDGAGGLSFGFGPNFIARPGVADAWQRALATWRCATGMNWQAGPPAPTDAIALDGQNVVAFDQGNALPANVLARTTSYYQACYTGTGTTPFYVAEVDMQFDDGTSFQPGPAPAVAPEIDFESVAVHELGHAQQLAHIIQPRAALPRAVMHFGLARGQNTRQLSLASDVAGGRHVLRARSFRPLGCGGPTLLPAPLTALAASPGPDGVRLAWTTRAECFLAGFVVERSAAADTTGPWRPLGTLPVGGPGYQFFDPTPPPALAYYRLGLRRPDGSTDYAAPLPVSADNQALALFPNPVGADGQAQLQLAARQAATLTFRVYDALGRHRLTRVAGVQAGLNVVGFDAALLPPGWYVLAFTDASGVQRHLNLVRE